MSDTLKRCPFCGGRELGCDGHYFYCTTCHATGPDQPLPDRAWAAQLWNRRSFEEKEEKLGNYVDQEVGNDAG